MALGLLGVLLGTLVFFAGGLILPPTVRAGPEVPATAMNQTLGTANNSPVLAADPTEPRFVVLANRVDGPDFNCSLQVSGDGGRSWVPVVVRAKLPSGVEKCYAPEVAFDAKGVFYYLFVGLAGPGNRPAGTFLLTSADRARTFSQPRQVLGPLNYAVRMAIDPASGSRGRLHLVWLHAGSEPSIGAFGSPPNPIQSAHSDDGGKTFSKPVQVSDSRRQRVVAPALALGPGHEVNVAYYDLKDDARDYENLEGPIWEGNWELVMARSQGGARFDRAEVVESSVVPPERPILIFTMAPPGLAVDDRGGVCVAWSDARHGDPDIFSRCQPPSAGGWSKATRLNDDRIGGGARQFLPRLSFSSNGRLDAIFYDRRDDRHGILNQVYYAYSVDRGRHFAPNVRVTREPSDSRVGSQYVGPSAEGQYEIGSRLGLLSLPSRAIAAWADARNSRVDTTGQDIFVSLVEVKPPVLPQRAGVIAVVLGLVLAVTGLGGKRASSRGGPERLEK